MLKRASVPLQPEVQRTLVLLTTDGYQARKGIRRAWELYSETREIREC